MATHKVTIPAAVAKVEQARPLDRLAQGSAPKEVLPESVSSTGPSQGPQPAGPAAATGAKIGSPRRLTTSAKQSVQTILATWALRELLARRLALPRRRRRNRDEQA
jgi:hypothetical protein